MVTRPPVGAAVDHSAAIEEHLPNPSSLGSLSDYVSCAGKERAEDISLFRREVKGFTRRGAPNPTGLRPEHLIFLAEGRHADQAAAYRNAIRAGAILPLQTTSLTSTISMATLLSLR